MKKNVFTILFGPQLCGKEIVNITKKVVSLQNNNKQVLP